MKTIFMNTYTIASNQIGLVNGWGYSHQTSPVPSKLSRLNGQQSFGLIG